MKVEKDCQEIVVDHSIFNKCLIVNIGLIFLFFSFDHGSLVTQALFILVANSNGFFMKSITAPISLFSRILSKLNKNYLFEVWLKVGKLSSHFQEQI